MIYFDNSATTNFKPLSVKLSVINNLRKTNIANPGRSGHELSKKLGIKIYKARESFARTFNTSPFDVIFTSGCTESLNIAIFGTVKNGGHIITTLNEHNSVLRSLKKIEIENNVDITYLNTNQLGEIDKYIKSNTYMIIINHTSNVTGEVCDIERVGITAKKFNLLYLVDAAQSAGHIKIDMKKNNINFLAIAGHKGLHGIAGAGALLINNCDHLLPLRYGGTGTNSKSLIQPTDRPEGLESGTMNYVNILAMEKGLIYTYKYFDTITKKISDLTKYLQCELNKLDNVIVYSPENNSSGVVAFNVKGYSSGEISEYLNSNYNIYIRSGLQCAPLIHEKMGTIDSGVCRVSLDFVNKKWQINKLIYAIKSLKN